MNVIIKVIKDDKGSIKNSALTFSVPEEIQSKKLYERSLPSAGIPCKVKKNNNDKIKEAIGAEQDINEIRLLFAPFSDLLLERANVPDNKEPNKGKRGIRGIKLLSIITLPLHQIKIINI